MNDRCPSLPHRCSPGKSRQWRLHCADVILAVPAESLNYASPKGPLRWRRWIAWAVILGIASAGYHYRRSIAGHVHLHRAYRQCLAETVHPSGVAFSNDIEFSRELFSRHPDLITSDSRYHSVVYATSPSWDALASGTSSPFASDRAVRTQSPSNFACVYLNEHAAPDGGKWLVCVEVELTTPADYAASIGFGNRPPPHPRPVLHLKSLERPGLLGRPRSFHATCDNRGRFTSTAPTAAPPPDLAVYFSFAAIHGPVVVKRGLRDSRDPSAFSIECKVEDVTDWLDGHLANDGSIRLTPRNRSGPFAR
jgi:hypothetical protein